MNEIERVMKGNKLWREYRSEGWPGTYMEWLEIKVNELREQKKLQEHQTESTSKAAIYFAQKT